MLHLLKTNLCLKNLNSISLSQKSLHLINRKIKYRWVRCRKYCYHRCVYGIRIMSLDADQFQVLYFFINILVGIMWPLSLISQPIEYETVTFIVHVTWMLNLAIPVRIYLTFARSKIACLFDVDSRQSCD